jgi:hypothetical protein
MLHTARGVYRVRADEINWYLTSRRSRSLPPSALVRLARALRPRCCARRFSCPNGRVACPCPSRPLLARVPWPHRCAPLLPLDPLLSPCGRDPRTTPQLAAPLSAGPSSLQPHPPAPGPCAHHSSCPPWNTCNINYLDATYIWQRWNIWNILL